MANGDDETIADHWSSIRALSALIPDMRVTFTDVLVYSKTGMVNNVVVEGTTGEDTTIELPAFILLLFDGTGLARIEAFDLDQRDQTLARFGELNH